MKLLSRRFLPLCGLSSIAFGLPALAQNGQSHPSIPELKVPNAVGVNIHFTDARPGEMKMLADGGFRVVRMDLIWNETEKAKGVYDFSAYDRLLSQLETQGIQPLFILVYTNPLYDENLSPYTDEGREAFAKWAAAAAVHFKGHKVLWEMYNEPNGFWRPKADIPNYIKLALATGKALKAAAPGECYIGPALSWFDFSYFEPCFKAGLLNYWDAVSVHPYRGGHPESAGDEFRRLRLMIERYKPKGKTIPVLSGEWGYSTKGMSEEQQAKYLSRQWLSNLSNRVPVSVWYDWKNDGTDLQENEHNFGTVGHDYHEGRNPVYDPKPSYIAARTFTQSFNGFRFNKRLALTSPNDYLLVFSKGDEVKLAAWTPTPDHEIVVPASAGNFKVVNYLGQTQPDVKATTAGLKLRIGDAPLYLSPTTTNEVLRRAATWEAQPLEKEVSAPTAVRQGAQTIELRRDSPPLMQRSMLRVGTQKLAQETQIVVANPLAFTVEPSVTGKLLVRAHNRNGVAFPGTISLTDGGAQKVTFAEAEYEKTLEFPLPKPAADGSWTTKINFTGTQPNDKVETTFRSVPFNAFSRLTPENLSDSFTANSDGDPAVASKQTLSIIKDSAYAAPEGGLVMSLKYHMSPGWKFINLQPRGEALAKVEGRPRHFGVWIYGDKSGNLVRLRYSDSTGQTFQPSGTAIDWTGWKYVTFPLDSTNAHWNGANDGEIHGAIKSESLLLLDSASQKESAGEIHFSSPSWVY
ncbi:hypothetical protein EON80_05790 [bacterium]|nr:MAG: hypothetical protein EON80_05790 [bacterium]